MPLSRLSSTPGSHAWCAVSRSIRIRVHHLSAGALLGLPVRRGDTRLQGSSGRDLFEILLIGSQSVALQNKSLPSSSAPWSGDPPQEVRRYYATYR